MSEEKRKITLLGIELEVIDVPIIAANEHFNEYDLGDGHRIKVKNVATSIVRIAGQTNHDGNPVYLFFSTPVITVEPGDATKKGK